MSGKEMLLFVRYGGSTYTFILHCADNDIDKQKFKKGI